MIKAFCVYRNFFPYDQHLYITAQNVHPGTGLNSDDRQMITSLDTKQNLSQIFKPFPKYAEHLLPGKQWMGLDMRKLRFADVRHLIKISLLTVLAIRISNWKLELFVPHNKLYSLRSVLYNQHSLSFSKIEWSWEDCLIKYCLIRYMYMLHNKRIKTETVALGLYFRP